MGSTDKRDKFQRGMVWLLCLGLIGAVGWAGTSYLQQKSPEPRTMTTDEAKRLSQIKVTNHESDPVGMSVDFPDDAGGGGLRGEVDWQQQLINAAQHEAGESRPQELVQAVPGLIATHEATENDESLPSDGWKVRRMNADGNDDDHVGTVTDVVLSAMLMLNSKQPASPKKLQDTGAWLREAAIDGATVDVFRAPLQLDEDSETAGNTAAEAIFWVDRDSQLRRVQFNPTGAGMTTADLLLEEKVDPPAPVNELGGPAPQPRDVKDGEAEALARMRPNLSQGGARIDMQFPTADDTLIQASGYADWRLPVVYLAVDSPGEKNDELLYVLPGGISTNSTQADGMPPSSPPQDGWETQVWQDRLEDEESNELDTMLYRLLALTNPESADPSQIQKDASWLREDTVGDTSATVYEYPMEGDTETEEPGQAPFRYWISEEDDSLQRMEMRTNELGMAHTDITAGADMPDITPPMTILNDLNEMAE